MIFTTNVLDWQQAVLENNNPVSSDVWKQSTALLKICRHNHIKATFFLQDSIVTKYPVLVRRIITEGHEVGCLFQPAQSTPELDNTITDAINHLSKVAEQTIRASRMLDLDKKDVEAYCSVLQNNNILYDSSLFSSKNENQLGKNKATQLFNQYNIQQYPQAALFNIPLTNNYLISFGNKSFRLLPYAINRLFNLNKNSNTKLFTVASYDLPSAALDNIRESHRISLKNQLDFIGRGKIPIKLLKLLRDYPFTSIAEYYDSNHPKETGYKGPARL